MTTTPHAWATAQFGLRLHDGAGTSDGQPLSALVQPGLRRNPRRAHLLVSTVLGKHIAVSPTVTLGEGSRLWESPDELLDRYHCDVVPSPSGVIHHLFWRR